MELSSHSKVTAEICYSVGQRSSMMYTFDVKLHSVSSRL